METSMEDWRSITEGEPSPEVVSARGAVFPGLCSSSPVELTVWCKSLLFHGHGYTVYDSGGRVLFRVENYAHDWRQETVLMDKSGDVLITVRRCRKILNLTESWEAFKGDHKDPVAVATGQRRLLFKARRNLCNHSCRVSMVAEGALEPLGYRMSWSRHKELFTIHHIASNKRLAAELGRKYGGASPRRMLLLDKDVLTLKVHPGMDQAIVMAIIMISNSMTR